MKQTLLKIIFFAAYALSLTHCSANSGGSSASEAEIKLSDDDLRIILDADGKPFGQVARKLTSLAIARSKSETSGAVQFDKLLNALDAKLTIDCTRAVDSTCSIKRKN